MDKSKLFKLIQTIALAIASALAGYQVASQAPAPIGRCVDIAPLPPVSVQLSADATAGEQ